MRIKEVLTEEEKLMEKEETKMAEKFKLFEEKIQMASQTAQDALDNMEKWRRRRVLLEQPIIKLGIIRKRIFS